MLQRALSEAGVETRRLVCSAWTWFSLEEQRCIDLEYDVKFERYQASLPIDPDDPPYMYPRFEPERSEDRQATTRPEGFMEETYEWISTVAEESIAMLRTRLAYPCSDFSISARRVVHFA